MPAARDRSLERAVAPATTEAADAQASAATHVSAAGAAPRDRMRLLWIVGYMAAIGVLFLCYLRMADTTPVTADGGVNAAQAWDMLHGNWLLHGWTLSDVSFYTTELPEFVLVEAVRGLTAVDVHICAAITYTLLVVLAGLLAKGTATGREGLVRILIGSGIMLAPYAGEGTYVLLTSPDHTGTGMPLLLTFLLLDRGPRRWWLAAAVGLMLAWAQVADPLVVTVGVLPVVVVCAVRAYRAVMQRREPVATQWFRLVTGAAVVISVGVAAVAMRIIRSLGGYELAPLHTAFAPSSSWPGHVSLTIDGILQLYGLDLTNGSLRLSTAITAIHVVGVALAAWAVCRVLRRFLTWPDPIAQILTVAIVANLAAYLVSTLPANAYASHEIAPVLPFGAVLAGRTLAARLMAARLLPVLAMVACGYLIAFGHSAVRPAAPVRDAALIRWLGAHHLTTGFGSYAEAGRIQLESHGAILMTWPQFSPQSTAKKGQLFEERAADFDPRRHYANFVVSTRQDGSTAYVHPSWVIRAFGHPARTYHYGPWTIMTWNKNLLAEVR